MIKFAFLPGLLATMAACAHEANAAYCRSMGDDSQKPWDEAPEWQKESAINGVNFHLENPDAGPEGSHQNWMAHKLADGWVFGEVKDEEKKTHPCLVPYADLPAEQRVKDFIFVSVIKGIANHLPNPSISLNVVIEHLPADAGAGDKAAKDAEAAAQADADAKAAKKAKADAEKREKAATEAHIKLREERAAAFESIPKNGLTVDALQAISGEAQAHLVFGNASGFWIGPEIDVSGCVKWAGDYLTVTKHVEPALEEEAFLATTLTLLVEGNADGVATMEFSPLQIGGGQSVRFPENSLAFRGVASAAGNDAAA